MAPCDIPPACVQHSTACTLHAKRQLGFGSASIEAGTEVFFESFVQEEIISSNQENQSCASSFDHNAAHLNNKTLLASSDQI